MRFQFKTSYNQDIRIFRDRVDAFWYGLLALVVRPQGLFGTLARKKV